MLAIVVGLLLTVAVALGIVVLVALPNLRQGSPILTPDGERVIKRAKQQAKERPLAAAGSTWHGLVAVKGLLARLSRQIARIWAPVGTALHGAMDRLEDRDAVQANGSGPDAEKSEPLAAGHGRAGTPIRHAAGPSRPHSTGPEPASVEPLWPAGPEDPPEPTPPRRSEAPGPPQDRYDVTRIVGGSSVGHPRTRPAVSGPIPEITGDDPARTRATGSGADVDQDGRTIDLREAKRPAADQEAGSARRSR